ncbi:ABC transporter ATP-binding protein [Chelatococcus sp. GCM10030263]|uniref:ABC transporter ATP-binding protein n=1 Tax=Chelatococcus sp. GCM10030263 TaxID=3273387 RepID=UPI00360D0800
MQNAATLLEVAGLSKIYANTGDGPAGGLRSADFALPRGTFFTLLGPSGCGKTTTLRCIAGLEQPDQGLIRIGEDVMFSSQSNVAVPLNRRNIGMVFQSYAIWPHMTVFENVAFPLRVAKDRSYGKAEIERMVGEALETVSLGGFGSRSVTRLSGGQQQRVALARAIVRKPRLLLLDEPLSNLDASLREEMRNELRRLQQQIGVTTVYVTHDQHEALEMSDRIAVMNQGRVVQIGAPRDIYFDPANTFVARFVGTTNWLEGTIEPSDANAPRVRLADGSVIACRANDEVRPGERVSVSIRPESIRLGAAATGDQNRLQGAIVFSSFVGNMTRYQLSCGEALLQAYDVPNAPHGKGDSVPFSFAASDALVFRDQP